MGRKLEVSLKHHLGRGLGLGAAMVAATQVLIWLGLGLTDWPLYVTVALTGLFAERGVHSLEQLLGERLLSGQVALMIGVMTLIAALLHQAFMFLHVTYVDPTWVDNVAGVIEAERGLPSAVDYQNRWRPGYVFTLGALWFAFKHWMFGTFIVTFGPTDRPKR